MANHPISEFESQCYPIKGILRQEFDNISSLKRRRYGNTVKIGKSEWNLGIYKRYQDRLCYFIRCHSNLGKGMKIPTTFTIQLINQNGLENCSKKQSYCYEKSMGSGWPQFISWREMMNGGYVKDDKIILEAYISIESESTVPRRTIDFNQQRPNGEDLENMFRNTQNDQIVIEHMENFVNISDISDSTHFTDSLLINGLPCCIGLQKRIDHGTVWLELYFYVNRESKNDWWRCKASVEFTIVNHKNNGKDCRRSTLIRSFHSKSTHYGSITMNWDELIYPLNGFIRDGKIQIKTRVEFHGKWGIDEMTGKGYEQPMDYMTDAVITVDEKKFHVSKTILALKSQFFNNIFQFEKNEYEIFDVYPSVFKQFLEIVYDKDTYLTEDTLEPLLETVKEFEAPECFERIDVIMKKYSIVDTIKMLKLVDKYPLPALQINVLHKLKVNYNWESIVKGPIYKTLTDRLKVEILEWKLFPLEQQTEQPLPTRFEFSTDFEKVSPHSDVIIQVMNYTYHASKQILANASYYFMKRFYGPYSTNDTNIELLDVHPLDFETLLTHIYHPSRPVTGRSVDILLKMGKQFSCPKLMDKCEEHLVLRSGMELIDKVEYVGKYNLPFLMEACCKLAEQEGEMEKLGYHWKYYYILFNIVEQLWSRRKESFQRTSRALDMQHAMPRVVPVSTAVPREMYGSPALPGAVPVSPDLPRDVPVSSAFPSPRSPAVPLSPDLPRDVPMSPAMPHDVPAPRVLPGTVRVLPTSSGAVPVVRVLPRVVHVPRDVSSAVPVSPDLPRDVPVSPAVPRVVPVFSDLSRKVPVSPAMPHYVPAPHVLPCAVRVLPTLSGAVPVSSAFPSPESPAMPGVVHVSPAVPLSPDLPSDVSVSSALPVYPAVPPDVPAPRVLPGAVRVLPTLSGAVPVLRALPRVVPVPPAVPVPAPRTVPRSGVGTLIDNFERQLKIN